MAATANTPRRPAGERPSWVVRVVVGGVVLFAVVSLSILVISAFGAVIGWQFCPDDFRRESYVYYEIPLIRVPVTSTGRTVTTGDTEAYLIAQKLIVPQTKVPVRWDLIATGRASGMEYWGDASILVKFLDHESDGKKSWVAWSDDNAARAKVFWPAVAQVARHQLYIFVPDLFELTSHADDPQVLQRKIDQLLAGKYQNLAGRMVDESRYQDAIGWYTQALMHDGKHAASLRGRARAYDALGEAAKAASDRAKLAELGAAGAP
jgi:hypothetical protein